MTSKESPATGKRTRLWTLIASLTLGAGVALGTLTSLGSGAKAQDLQWATRAGGVGGTGFDTGRSIATTLRGESYVTGEFQGTATFGPGEANQTVLTSAGDDDVFVAKYDRDGALLWATRAGGTGFDAGLGIATTPQGESYVTGEFQGTATFGPGEANQTVLTSASGDDIFVAKYDRDGALLWATRAGGTATDDGFGIAATPRGESYVTGRFAGTATFGPGEANQTVLTSAGGDDIFVAKYDRDGALLWATRAGGTGSGFERGLGIATTPRGESHVTGEFQGTATFGPGEPNQTTLTAAGSSDIFVAKFR